jgi:ribosomal protein L11 methyltransferase
VTSPASPASSAPLARGVFGDGSHPTTRLCAAAVDLLCRQQPGMAVLDVGTGTGILARIARARGASFVVGTDIDPAAVACAKAHAELDDHGTRADAPNVQAAVTSEREAASGMPGAATGWPADAPDMRDAATCVRTAAPTMREAVTGMRTATPDIREVVTEACHINIHFGDEAPDHWRARFDLVVANILEAPLHTLAPALRRALVPGGLLVISGFTRPQVPALRLAFETAGLQSAGDFNLDEWVLLKFVAPIQADHNFSR